MDSESQEYRTILQCYPKLVHSIKQAPTDLAIELRPSGILADTDWQFLMNPQPNNKQKAIRIVDVVLNQIKIDPQSFSVFVYALEAAGSWAKAVVSELKPLLRHNSLPNESGELKLSIF